MKHTILSSLFLENGKHRSGITMFRDEHIAEILMFKVSKVLAIQ